MRGTQFLLVASIAVLFPAGIASAQSPLALAGQVSSAEEGAMEGVLVSAKLAGSNKTITVVSDEKGRYSFPAARLEPGKYTITIRAARLRPRGLASTAGGRGEGSGDCRPETGQDQGPCRAAHERRMAAQRARHTAAEAAAALLRRLPHARAHHALQA